MNLLILAYLRSSTSHLAEKTRALRLALSWNCWRTSFGVRRWICARCCRPSLLLCGSWPRRRDRWARSAAPTTRSSLTRHIRLLGVPVREWDAFRCFDGNEVLKNAERKLLSLATYAEVDPPKGCSGIFFKARKTICDCR